MGKQSGLLKQMQRAREDGFADGQRLGQQQAFDAAMIWLHRQGWGAKRIERLNRGILAVMEEYAKAFFVGMEQDVAQERMDAEIRAALKGTSNFYSFAERYPEVKIAGYDRLPKE